MAALAELQAREEARFVELHPRSQELAERAQGHLFEGVPMHWMRKWPGGFPVFVREAKGARFRRRRRDRVRRLLPRGYRCDGRSRTRADAPRDRRAGREGTDAHAPERRRALGVRGAHAQVRPPVLAIRAHGDRREPVLDPSRPAPHRPLEGARVQLVLPRHGRRGVRVARRRCRRCSGRQSRAAGRPGRDDPCGRVQRRGGARSGVGAEGRRSRARRACVDERRHRPSRARLPRRAPRADATARHAARDRRDAHDLLRAGWIHCRERSRAGHPDDRQDDRGRDPCGGVRVLGGGGGAANRDDRARRDRRRRRGGTLAGNALSLAAMRATLGEVLTDEVFARMIPLAERWTGGVESAIAEAGPPWHVTRLGCRAEYLFGSERPRNGAEAHAAGDAALERYMHLFALNRGILLTPFHNMALMCPASTEADVDRHTEVFRDAALELAG